MLKHQIIKLKSGLTVIQIPMESVQSVTVLALCNTGSRYERAVEQGIAHFFEHIVFKGTANYPTSQILSNTIDGIGASFNAFTSKEYTGYYVKAASEHTELALDVVSDLVLTPRLRQEDINREKGVIIEEINMYADNPSSHIANLFEQMVFAKSGLEHDIIGTKATVSKINSKKFGHFLKEWYSLGNLQLVIAGDATVVGKKALLKKIEKFFAKKSLQNKKSSKTDKIDSQLYIKQDATNHAWDSQTLSSKKLLVHFRKTEQAHFIIGFPGLKQSHPERYAAALLSALVGGNSSSRLFTEVREKRGLCYYVHSDNDQYHDTGFFGASAGVDPSRVEEAVQVTLAEFTSLVDGSKPVTAEELKRTKDFVAGRLILGLEDSRSVAQYYGLKELLLNKILSPEEVLRKIKAVTLSQVQAVAKKLILRDQVRFGIIGPFTEPNVFEKLVAA